MNSVACEAAVYAVFHGIWFSLPNARFQNACWCREIKDRDVERIKKCLRGAARDYHQDSIAWAEAPQTKFLSPHD